VTVEETAELLAANRVQAVVQVDTRVMGVFLVALVRAAVLAAVLHTLVLGAIQVVAEPDLLAKVLVVVL
jgi:hypothetical protein